MWTFQPTNGLTTQFVSLNPVAPSLTTAQFTLFAVSLVEETGIISSMIIAVIQTGKKSNFIKYIIPFLVVSLLVFFVGGNNTQRSVQQRFVVNSFLVL